MLQVLTVETLYAIGISVLVFRVFPFLPSVHGLVLMLGVSFMPSLLKLLFRPEMEDRRWLKIILDIGACIVQLSVLILWPILLGTILKDSETSKNEYIQNYIWAIPLALFLISVRWWENYVGTKLPKNHGYASTRYERLLAFIQTCRKQVRRSRTKLHIVASLWKCGVTILTAMLLQKDRKMVDMFKFTFEKRCENNATFEHIPGLRLDWVWVFLINFACGLVVYCCARTAAKVQIQRISYAVPLLMTTPILFGLLIGGCEIWNKNHCAFGHRLPTYMFFHCHPEKEAASLFDEHHIYVMVIWWLSQLWITWHIWFPTSERLVRTEK